jgi:adenylate kinase
VAKPSKRTAIILLGPPASGKTSLAQQLSSERRMAIIETGRLLRREVERRSSLGRRLETYMEAGRLAPVDWVAEVVAEAVRQTSENSVWFDGFPRNEDQIEALFKILKDAGLDLAAVLVFDLSDQEVKQRITGRRICPRCGAVYNIHSDPPAKEGICNQCGAGLIRRDDDSEGAAEERLRVYRRETLPVIAFFKSRHPAITAFFKSDSSRMEVVQELQAFLDETLGPTRDVDEG